MLDAAICPAIYFAFVLLCFCLSPLFCFILGWLSIFYLVTGFLFVVCCFVLGTFSRVLVGPLCFHYLLHALYDYWIFSESMELFRANRFSHISPIDSYIYGMAHRLRTVEWLIAFRRIGMRKYRKSSSSPPSPSQPAREKKTDTERFNLSFTESA